MCVCVRMQVGVCGDWLGGASMQSAAVSGVTLARQIAGARVIV